MTNNVHTERQLQTTIVSLAMQDDRLEVKGKEREKLFIYNTVSFGKRQATNGDETEIDREGKRK